MRHSQDYENLVAFNLDSKLFEPEALSPVDHGRSRIQVEFKTVPGTTQNLAGTSEMQIVGPFALA
jgi:hypothetical protein